jgi:CRISPR-associated protein Csx10
MTHYRITATLLAPLAVQRTRQTNAPQALPYLPGSTFRGAVAAKYLREGGSPEDESFRALFVDDPVSFPDLLPADSGGKTISQVLPLTSVSCKRHPGFKSQNGHGITDLLAQKLVERHNFSVDELKICLDCKNDLKAITGFWNGNINTPELFQPTMFFQRHTGIDRDTGTVAHKIFFITQAMADLKKTASGNGYEKQVLSGNMFMDDQQFTTLEPLLQGTLFAGQDRTRGMGELQIAADTIDTALPDIENWSKEFSSILDRIAPAHLNSDFLSGLYFSLKLESHAILLDEFLRPTYEIELSFPGVKPVLKVAKSQLVKGWNNAWGMAKPDDMGVMMGSVYLYRYSGGDMEGLRSYLARLATIGIGQRRSEGFGRVLICDPLHMQRKAI